MLLPEMLTYSQHLKHKCLYISNLKYNIEQ